MAARNTTRPCLSVKLALLGQAYFSQLEPCGFRRVGHRRKARGPIGIRYAACRPGCEGGTWRCCSHRTPPE